MIRRELALKLARLGSVRRWDPNIQVVYDNRRRPRSRRFEEQIRRYDRALFVRFNAMAERWELFRWRGIAAPRLAEIPTIPADEMARRSMFLWTIQDRDGGYMDPDSRTVRMIQLGDLFSKFGSSSAKVIADALDEEDRQVELQQKQDLKDSMGTMVERLAFDARKLTGRHKVFSHSR